MPDHDAFRPDGRLNIPSQAAADYIAREGTLQPYEPTMRETFESAIAGALKNLGMSKSSARDSAVGFTGTTDSSRGGLGVGVLDFFPPFSIPTALQEAGREVERAQTATDYINPVLTVGFSAIESIPAAKLATKPLKGFINNLATKAEPEPLIAAAGPKVPRRTVVKGLAATPVAGALSKLPLDKVDEVAPVVKKVSKALPDNFSLGALKSFKKGVNSAKSQLRREYRWYDPDAIPDLIQQMDEMSVDEMLDERMATGDIYVEDLIEEIKAKYPDASSDEIAKLFPEGAVSKEAIDLFDADSTFVEVPAQVAVAGDDFITRDELIEIGKNKGYYNKSSKIYKTKKQALKALNDLKKRYPNMEFVSGYHEYPDSPILTGHRIYYKLDKKDKISPGNNDVFDDSGKRLFSLPSDFTVELKGYIPSEKAPK